MKKGGATVNVNWFKTVGVGIGSGFSTETEAVNDACARLSKQYPNATSVMPAYIGVNDQGLWGASAAEYIPNPTKI